MARPCPRAARSAPGRRPVAYDLFRGAPSRPAPGRPLRREIVGRGGVPRLPGRGLIVCSARKTCTRRDTRAASPCWRSRWERCSASAGPPASARNGRAPARHRQALGPGRRPDQAGRAHHPLESAIVQKHPVRGDALLGSLGFSARQTSGAGPPRAARRDRLPRRPRPAPSMETRMLGVCDVYDALLSDRCYREARAHERAIALLLVGGRSQLRWQVRRGAEPRARPPLGAARPRRRLLAAQDQPIGGVGILRSGDRVTCPTAGSRPDASVRNLRPHASGLRSRWCGWRGRSKARTAAPARKPVESPLPRT